MAMAGGLMAALYILNILGPVMDPFQWAQRLSLFYYFRPMEIMIGGEFALSSVLVYLGITAICFAAALVLFQRRKAVV